jgi:TonB family protein
MIATVKVEDDSLSLFVKKFRSLCDMHSVRFGLQENFGEFTRQLVEDRKFAMDFWALAGRFSSREGGPLSDEQMLGIIVQEIAGCAMTSLDEGLKPQINDLARMFAGEDIQSPIVHDDTGADIFAPPPEPKLPPIKRVSNSTPQFSASSSMPQAESTPQEKHSAPELAKKAHEQKVDDPILEVENRSPAAVDTRILPHELPALAQHQLDEALLRLERSSRELKLHLDNIDNRMRRMEPHLEELASKISVHDRVPPPAREPIREPIHEDIRPFQQSVGRAVERSRLVLEEPPPAPVSHAASKTIGDDDPSIPVPLAAYPQRRFNRSAGLFAALFLIVAGGLFFLHQRYGASLWADFGPSLHERYDAARQELRGVMGKPAADESQSVAANTQSQSPATPVASTPVEPGANDIPKAATEPQTAAEPQNANSQPVAEPQAVNSQTTNSQALNSSTSSTEAPSRHKGRHGVPTERDLASSDSASVNSGLEAPVPVAPAVMQENLVVSRVPAYPEVARADHVEGPVVMQAIISKSGTVGHLHVVQGDPLLRGAASEAVSKWRYRPYTVNGRPVEVATTVTVDFKLNK